MKRQEGLLYEPLVWSISSFLVLSGAALAILMWANVIGPFRFMSMSEEAASRSVGLWIPNAPRNAVPEETTRRLGLWRRMLPEDRPTFASHDLEVLMDEAVGVVVVPDARDLTQAQTDALWSFLSAGGGAVLTGAVGVRGADGSWRGFDLMSRLLAVPAIHTLPAEAAREMAPSRPGPIAGALREDQPVRVAPEPGVPSVPDAVAEVRWAGDDDSIGGEPRGAVRRLAVGLGRVVWLAAGPEAAWDVELQPWNPMIRLVHATVAWVSRDPMVQVIASTEVVAGFRRVGPRRLLLRVTNLAEDDSVRATLRVHLNLPIATAEVAGTDLLQEAPRLQLSRDAEHVDLLLPELAAGQSRAYNLDYQPAGPEA